MSLSGGATADGGAGFAETLIAWQRTHGRHSLPWQKTRDPYRVWLSEIMLQQTQVATVLGYFERFLARFPDVAALAAASQAEVLALWSGLGYYSRARNLHRCAQVVVAEHGGRFPPTSAALAELPGIGRSTAAAIAAFCFGERVAILDGNVKRVLTRVLGFGGDLAEAAQERALWREATDLLPERGIEAYTQGLMDLGATLCAPRTPACLLCPVRALCSAAASGTQARYPVKTRRLVRGRRDHVWLWLQWGDRLWLAERPATGVWAGLWSLPEFEDADAFEAATATWPGTPEPLPAIRHVLTHLDWMLRPVRWRLPADTGAVALAAITARFEPGRWCAREEALAGPLPAPLRKLLVGGGAGAALAAQRVASSAGRRFLLRITPPRTDMSQTSTADSNDASGKPIESATDPQVTKPGSTHSTVSGELSPRLPHEHDESSDSGTRPPDPVMEQAAEDAQGPKQQTDRGEQTEEVYRRNLRGSAGDPD